MGHKKNLYILLLILALTVSMLAIPAIADAGSFSGSSDYGGGSSFGGDYDFGNNDYGSYNNSYNNDDDGDFGIGLVIVIVILVLYFVFKGKGKGGVVVGGGEQTPTGAMSPLSVLKEKDPNFSEAAIEEKIANLYVQMQQAWQGKDFEPMRPHMTDTLYNQFARQLDELVRANATNYVERIAVLGVDLTGCAEDEINDILVATVRTRIIDYTVDDKSGNVISGSKTAEKFMTYEWTLIRSKGMTTPAPSGSGSENTTSVHCPSCGAPLDVNQSAKCPYCDAVISARDYDWVISAVKGISQRTGS